ncbi:TPR Domain containing protein [Trichomonas vaginalis G3]|uniref:TPR Domain containing protein n=1 Tax=Trichomonas vaginalis (strain ATCC PRA-98 / G3) TaxID=412133 RepID=A2G222_TRIV3|nr:negative regulation of ER-associated ubiquitin-dependent protein catabolic process [Trichomonas vaginalis G3]EAX88797.1 TPR Domain containing protein [Trichomonas vaginalis G3]KAI5530057.1 negative regulation of ER-associated ubiquitin-dependent protein catabolic process [Trichomonas vaginalis G3]|eukprot:XP_001301727.1 TPR Domain containing protein [Trichomonas vaginalis G3]
MNSQFSHPVMEWVDSNLIHEIALEDQKTESSVQQITEILKNPSSVTPRTLSEQQKSSIMTMMNTMCQQATKVLEETSEETENSLKHSPTDEELFNMEKFPPPLTLKFRKSHDELIENEKFNQNRVEKLKQKTTTINKTESEEIKAQGNVIYKSGDFGGAIAKYNSAIFHNPLNHINHSNRASAYLATEHPSMAISDCQWTLELNSDFVKAYVRMGKAYMDSGKIFKALDYYDIAINKDPQYEEALLAREEAIDEMNRMTPNNTDNILARRFFGVEYEIPDYDKKLLQNLIDFSILSYN